MIRSQPCTGTLVSSIRRLPKDSSRVVQRGFRHRLLPEESAHADEPDRDERGYEEGESAVAGYGGALSVSLGPLFELLVAGEVLAL